MDILRVYDVLTTSAANDYFVGYSRADLSLVLFEFFSTRLVFLLLDDSNILLVLCVFVTVVKGAASARKGVF